MLWVHCRKKLILHSLYTRGYNVFLIIFAFMCILYTKPHKSERDETWKKTLGVPLGNEAFSSVEKSRANSWDKFSFYWKCFLLRGGKEWKKRKDNLRLSVQNLPGPNSLLHFLSPSSSEMETGLSSVRAHLSSLELSCWIWRYQHKKTQIRLEPGLRRGWGPAKTELSAQASIAL